MRTLVAYMSQTGNTKKVAEAIYDAVPQPKEIMRVEDVKSLEGYDLSFLGFPTHAFGPDKKVEAFLGTHARGRTIALFITHMAPDDAPPLPEWVQKFSDAAAGANIVGVFHCQGQVSRIVKTFMRVSPDPNVRAASRNDSSQGKPDAASLGRARVFADEMVKSLESASK